MSKEVVLPVHVDMKEVDAAKEKLQQLHDLLVDTKELMKEVNSLADELTSTDINVSFSFDS